MHCPPGDYQGLRFLELIPKTVKHSHLGYGALTRYAEKHCGVTQAAPAPVIPSMMKSVDTACRASAQHDTQNDRPLFVNTPGND